MHSALPRGSLIIGASGEAFSGWLIAPAMKLARKTRIHRRMEPSPSAATDELHTIAKRVMRERGLLPGFLRAIRDETRLAYRSAQPSRRPPS